MEIPGTAALKEANLRLSTEAGEHVFLLEEPSSGRIFKVSPMVAEALLRAKHVLAGNEKTIDKKTISEITALAAHLSSMREQGLISSKTFNPLFVSIPLFDAQPIQKILVRPANMIFSYIGLAIFVFVALCVCWIMIANDLLFLSSIENIFSLQAILTFALIAPFLKLLHETGHVLAATRFDVPVRKAGIILIGLFPLPFVDCTQAEYRAGRFGRIIISLAGLMADISVGLVVVILWHFVDDGITRQILSNIVIFSTVMTVFFNLNPLMRLDGYFAMSDALHQRNLHLESAAVFAKFRGLFLDFEFKKAFQIAGKNFLQLIFAIMAAIYKVYILIFIAWSVAPKYLGVGIIIVAWGAAVIFLTPLLKGSAAEVTANQEQKKRRYFYPVCAGILTLFLFIPIPYHVIIPVQLDLEGAYSLRSETSGTIAQIEPAGSVQSGDVIARLNNIETAVAIALNDADVTMMSSLVDSVSAVDPLATQGAQERLAAVLAIGEGLGKSQKAQFISVPNMGWFVPSQALQPGSYIKLGDKIGYFLPIDQETKLIGEMSELYSQKFESDLVNLELKKGKGQFLKNDKVTNARINQTVGQSGSASILSLEVTALVAPQSLAGQNLDLKIEFAAEPLWRHGVFLYNRVRLNFLQAQELARADSV